MQASFFLSADTPSTHPSLALAPSLPQALAQKIHDKEFAKQDYVEEQLSRTYDVVFMSVNEPYRLVLSEIRDRLAHTK